MNGTRKVKGITVIALAVALGAGVPAVAGEDDDRGTVGGVSYLSDEETMLAGTPATVDVSCPADTYPVGGGFEVITAPAYSVYQTLPLNLDSATPGPDAWRTVGFEDSPPGNASPAVSHVICRTEASRYVKARGQLPKGTPGTLKLTATCPGGMHVTGGGAAAGINGTPGEAFVNSTHPVDTPDDADNVPDDGWSARVYGIRQPGTRVVAICADEMPSYDKLTFEVAAGSNTGASVDCLRREQVLGIGVRIDGNAAQGRAVGASPGDAFPGRPNDDANEVPDDVAFGVALNESGQPKNLTVFGICG